MQVRILSVFLLVSSSLIFSTVVCDPNHHHNHQNDFPWQEILSSLGIVVENQTSADATVGSKELYTSESTVEILKSETKDGIETPVVAQDEHYASESTLGILKSEATDGNETSIVAQNGTTIEVTSSNSSSEGFGLGYKVGIPIVGILFFICFWYCVCKFCQACVEVCCCGCCEEESPQVVVMQSNTVQNQQPAGPQIILQQPIIHQQVPPMYDAQKGWAQPPPQGPPQWSQPPQGQQQWTPHAMGQQQQYSPHGGYDNAGFNPATAPPPYNNAKY